MNKTAILAALAATTILTGCGTRMTDRMASGAAIGGGLAFAVTGIGLLPGAIVGAAVGGLISPEDVNLGEPVWEDRLRLSQARNKSQP